MYPRHDLVPLRVFVEFERPHPSHISPVQAVEPVLDSVYVALKRRHERNKLAIYIDDSADARVVGGARWKLPAPILESEEVECSHGNTGKPKGLKERTLPGPESSYQQIIITEVCVVVKPPFCQSRLPLVGQL